MHGYFLGDEAEPHFPLRDEPDCQRRSKGHVHWVLFPRACTHGLGPLPTTTLDCIGIDIPHLRGARQLPPSSPLTTFTPPKQQHLAENWIGANPHGEIR